MRYLLTFVICFALTAIAESAIITGHVVDRAGHNVSGARIRAWHRMPLIEKPPAGTWNGLLGEAYSDDQGRFSLHFSSRASLDYLLADGAGYATLLRAPGTPTVYIVVSPKRLSPEQEVERLRKRLPPERPNQAMERTADRRSPHI